MNHKQHTSTPLPWSVPIIKQGVKWKSVRPYLPNTVDFFNSWFQLPIMLRGSRQMYWYLIFYQTRIFVARKSITYLLFLALSECFCALVFCFANYIRAVYFSHWACLKILETSSICEIRHYFSPSLVFPPIFSVFSVRFSCIFLMKIYLKFISFFRLVFVKL